MTFDDELSAAARTLHREWETPDLWPTIAAEIAAAEGTQRRMRRAMPWRTFAAAAVVVLAVAASLVLMRDRLFRADTLAGDPARAGARLLSDEALSEIERAEARY